MNISRAIAVLQEQDGLVLPYGFMPGSAPGEVKPVASNRTAWDAYQWNPPQYLPRYTAPDPQASEKPTWAQLRAAWHDAPVRPSELRLALDIACTDAISAVYGAETWEEEIQRRLAGHSTPAQDEARERLIARAKVLGQEIDAAKTRARRRAILAMIHDGTWEEAT